MCTSPATTPPASPTSDSPHDRNTGKCHTLQKDAPVLKPSDGCVRIYLLRIAMLHQEHCGDNGFDQRFRVHASLPQKNRDHLSFVVISLRWHARNADRIPGHEQPGVPGASTPGSD